MNYVNIDENGDEESRWQKTSGPSGWQIPTDDFEKDVLKALGYSVFPRNAKKKTFEDANGNTRTKNMMSNREARTEIALIGREMRPASTLPGKMPALPREWVYYILENAAALRSQGHPWGMHRLVVAIRNTERKEQWINMWLREMGAKVDQPKVYRSNVPAFKETDDVETTDSDSNL